jgi:hypothetical protein
MLTANNGKVEEKFINIIGCFLKFFDLINIILFESGQHFSLAHEGMANILNDYFASANTDEGNGPLPKKNVQRVERPLRTYRSAHQKLPRKKEIYTQQPHRALPRLVQPCCKN